ncbi:MAG: amino acid racemase [Bacilli bacterium]|nr:amino acid racemase [Bacilli bacterium]
MKIGIIGGLGPLATVKFMEMLNERLKNDKNVEIIVINDPTTPDRTSYILNNKKDNPVFKILEMVKKLELFECNLIVMPCNTASYFYKEITKNTNIPFINIVEETVKYLNKNNIKKIGLLATEGTIKSYIYKELLDLYNIDLIVPDDKDQEIVSSIIYDGIKSNKEIDLNELYKVINDLKNNGSEKIILGCTELSALNKIYNLNNEILIDAMEILADSVIKYINHTN